jgi:hypothetical protein
VGINNLRVGGNKLELTFTRTVEGIFLEAARTAGTGESTIDFRPAVSLRATVQKAELNGKPIPFHVEANDEDQHVIVKFPVADGQKFLRILVTNDFAATPVTALPALGSTSTGVRILSETWSPSRDELTMDVSGAIGAQYELKLWNATQIERVEGAQLKKTPEGAILLLQIAGNSSEAYAHAKIVIHFSNAQSKAKRR